MPSLADIAGLLNSNENEAFDLPTEFELAKQSKQKPPPDLISAFRQAAQSGDEGKTDSEGRSELGKAKPPEYLLRDKTRNNHGRNRSNSDPDSA